MITRKRLSGHGLGVRSYLTALVLPPMMVIAVFAVQDVAEQRARADQAQQVLSAVTDASLIAHVGLGLLDEFIPAMARTFIHTPELVTELGGVGPSMASIGLSDQAIDKQRATTGRALAALDAAPDTRLLASSVKTTLTRTREHLDSPTSLAAGYSEFLDLIASTATQQRSAVTRARRHLTDGSAAARDIADLELVTTAAQTQSLVVTGVVSKQFAVADESGLITALETWGAARTAARAVRSDASGPVQAAWTRAMSSDAAVELDRSITSAMTTDTTFDVPTLVRNFSLESICDAATLAVVTDVAARVATAAARERDSAQRSAVFTAGLGALVLLLCAGGVLGVRRRMTRPLLALAGQARRISEGELVQVAVGGPLEVRTVADGLSAAVENLRKVADQAKAVASGNLSAEVVREPLPGALGAVMHLSVSAIVDAIQGRAAAQQDLAHRAVHDALTELPNRAQAMSSISKALQRARRTGALTCVMFVDLDRFKTVNDSFGHAAGDRVLQISAQRMQTGLRDGDEVFRVGGDEFIVLLERVDDEMESVHVAERMIENLSEPIDVGGGSAIVGASIGIAYSEDAFVDADRLLSDADAAMYRAKQSGRGRVGVFDEGLRAELQARTELEAAITAGIHNDEFLLHYQPIVDLRSGDVIGYEALIRWQRPGYGLVQPDDFIPVAEATRLIDALGRWALGEATGQLARWDRDGGPPDTWVAVNISGRHLNSNHLLDEVRDALDRSAVAPGRLIVEVTETVLVDNPVAVDNLARLRAFGVGIAIDDFGTGYTSIGQLPLLPIDKLKIDRSFVASADRAHHELVRLIVAAAHAFGLTVVAEGIETVEQADWLRDLGVEAGQGYLFARPTPQRLASTPEVAAVAFGNY